MDKLTTRFLTEPEYPVKHPELQIIASPVPGHPEGEASQRSETAETTFDIEHYLNDAQQNYEAKNYHEAIDAYNQLIHRYPSNSVLYHNRGVLHKANREFDQALKDFDQAIRLDKENTYAYFSRASLHKALSNFQDATEDYTSIIERNKRFIQILIEEHSQALNRGNLYLEQQYRTEVMRVREQQAVAHNDRGNAWADAQQYQWAIDDYNEAIKILPESAVSYLNRGLALESLGYPDEASRDYDAALHRDERNEGARIQLARTYLKQQKFGEAQKLCYSTLELNPQSGQAHSCLGEIFNAMGMLDGAMYEYRRAIELEPDNPQFYYVLAVAHRRAGELKEAFADYDAALELNPRFGRAYFSRGFTYHINNQLDKAKADYKSALNNGYTSPVIYWNLAQIAFEQGDFQESIAEYQATGDYQTNPHAVAGCAISYSELGKFEDAKTLWLSLDEKYQQIETIEKEFSWRPALIEAARRLKDKIQPQ